MRNSYDSFDPPREFVPAGFADVQASSAFPRRTARTRSDVKSEVPVGPTASERQAATLSAEQARQIEQYLKQLGDRLTHTRNEEVSGVAPTGTQSEYGLAG